MEGDSTPSLLSWRRRDDIRSKEHVDPRDRAVKMTRPVEEYRDRGQILQCMTVGMGA